MALIWFCVVLDKAHSKQHCHWSPSFKHVIYSCGSCDKALCFMPEANIVALVCVTL